MKVFKIEIQYRKSNHIFLKKCDIFRVMILVIVMFRQIFWYPLFFKLGCPILYLAFVRVMILYDWLWCLTYFCRFYNEMGGGSSKTTVNYLISLIDRVHKIYEDTVWRDSVNGQGFSGMGFIIKKIVVHKKPTEVREGKKRDKKVFQSYMFRKYSLLTNITDTFQKLS